MQVNVGPGAGDGRDGGPASADSLFERIGWRGLFVVVWRSTPLPLRLIAFPYGVLVYHSLLTVCQSPDYLYTLHMEKCRTSYVFRVLRPRYRTAAGVLHALLTDDGEPHAT